MISEREALLVQPEAPAALAAALSVSLRTAESARERETAGLRTLEAENGVNTWLA